jgi:hypothetical protein
MYQFLLLTDSKCRIFGGMREVVMLKGWNVGRFGGQFEITIFTAEGAKVFAEDAKPVASKKVLRFWEVYEKGFIY